MDSSPATDPYAAPKANVGNVELPSLAMRAIVARWLMFANALGIVAGMVITGLLYAHALSAQIGELQSTGVLLGAGIGCLRTVVTFASVVSFFVWLHTAYARATRGVADALFTPAASVGWWFVPVANLWMPLQAVRHLWQLSHSGGEWNRVAPPPRIGIWWAAFLVSTGGLCTAMVVMLLPGWTIASRVLAYGAACLSIVATLLAARIVGEITAMQQQRLGVD